MTLGWPLEMQLANFKIEIVNGIHELFNVHTNNLSFSKEGFGRFDEALTIVFLRGMLR